ncbi:hypothetical protein RIF29_35991 [Crotalaria pallida]|uniref:Uncharacterized protein n=1 Tax=Crotalaria pallida TaxID=3830 RepID=A0AAN9EAJ7_CROPI
MRLSFNPTQVHNRCDSFSPSFEFHFFRSPLSNSSNLHFTLHSLHFHFQLETLVTPTATNGGCSAPPRPPSTSLARRIVFILPQLLRV